MTQAAFDALYWASKDPQLQKLTDIPITPSGDDPLATRKTAAIQLATQGLVVDTQTMVWGWDPYLVMTLRGQFGIASVSGVLGNGVIKTSLDPADYPPFHPPPPPPPVSTSLVGASEGFDSAGVEYFACAFGNLPLKDGQVYAADPRGPFVYHFRINPFGGSQWFTKA